MVPRSRDSAIQPASTKIQPFSAFVPMTVARTEIAMSSVVQTPTPCITRSKNMYAGPHLRRDAGQRLAERAVGVEPTLMIRAFMPRRPQRLRGGDGSGPFVLRSPDEGLGSAEAVRFAGVGENAGELDAGLG